jgi:transposase
MRQTHVAGDKLFVDWAGDTAPIIDPMILFTPEA